ncbi:hypothetical protein D9Z01_07395 [Enterococcus faecalis]|nr:hypothetical protein [Enterococcus faecalis]
MNAYLQKLIFQDMSWKGAFLDNSPIKNFFSILNKQLYYGKFIKIKACYNKVLRIIFIFTIIIKSKKIHLKRLVESRCFNQKLHKIEWKNPLYKNSNFLVLLHNHQNQTCFLFKKKLLSHFLEMILQFLFTNII